MRAAIGLSESVLLSQSAQGFSQAGRQRRRSPAALRSPRDLQVQNAIQANHHPQARENLRMVLVGQPHEVEQPLWIISRVQTLEHILDARQDKGDAVLAAAFDHMGSFRVWIGCRCERLHQSVTVPRSYRHHVASQ